MYIFPQNYNFKNKFFGFIDYSTIIFNVIWYLFIYSLFSFIIKSFYFKICLFIIFSFPVFLVTITGINNENILYIIFYLLKFFKNRQIYLYSKY